jgi:hypothetical protein
MFHNLNKALKPCSLRRKVMNNLFLLSLNAFVENAFIACVFNSPSLLYN